MGSQDDLTLDFLAVGAHPDDVEIACGGTLAALSSRGYRVGIVDLTDGEPTPLSPGPDARLQEAQNAAKILGVATRITLNLPNRRLFDSFEARIELAKLIRRHRARVVVGFGGKTVMASPDHYQAMLITDAAVFYSRLTKWDEHFDHLPPHSVTAQYSFPLSLHAVDVPESAGHFVANISGHLETKLRSIRAYESQFPATKARIFAAVESMARYHGAVAGFEAGELFQTYRTIGVDDLVAWSTPASRS